MNTPFYKYHGTGNDFIIFDNRGNKIEIAKEKIHQLCHRRFGIGADGLMLMNKKEGFDFEMKYYNANGSESSMCGNGGRCMVQFAYDMGLSKSEYFFSAIDGKHKAAIEDNGWIDLKMKDVNQVEISAFSDFILDTGSPHYVKLVTNLWNYDVLKEGREIRYNKRFSKDGVNVNFAEFGDEETISVRTYERGVEDETFSCGTGVTAAALVFAHNDNGFNRVEVKTPGGQLAVEFDKIGETSFKNIWLCGPAAFVFRGETAI